jgi:hypothetical protein
MQTDTVCAFQVENNDHIVMEGKPFGYVYSIGEDGDYILLDVVDDEAEHTEFAFGAFDTVEIITSFDDEEVDIPDFIE